MTLRKPSSSHHVWLRRSYIWLSTGMGPSPRTNAERSNRIRPPPPLASAARRHSDIPPHIRGAPPHLACDLPLSWLGSAPLLAQRSSGAAPLGPRRTTTPLWPIGSREISPLARSHFVKSSRRESPAETPAARPKQASRGTEPRRSLVEEGERFGAAVGRLGCLSVACRSDARPPRGLTAGRP